jgi:hypothetical protein
MLIKDSCGRKSWHLTLAVPALIAGTIWFLAGGISLELPFGMKLTTATKSGSDFLLFATPWLSALGWRDYLKSATVLQPGETLTPEPAKTKE